MTHDHDHYSIALVVIDDVEITSTVTKQLVIKHPPHRSIRKINPGIKFTFTPFEIPILRDRTYYDNSTSAKE